jgi:uncharacterized protein
VLASPGERQSRLKDTDANPGRSVNADMSSSRQPLPAGLSTDPAQVSARARSSDEQRRIGLRDVDQPALALRLRSIPGVAVEVRDNPQEQRYEAAVDRAMAGFTAYRSRPGLIAFMHTMVDDAFEGHGVGSTLVSEALKDAQRRGLKVLPFCPFVNSYIEKHHEYLHLVPESHREDFGL